MAKKACADKKSKRPAKAAACACTCAKDACAFLDRDGVINEGGLLNKPEDVRIIPGAPAAITALKKAGYKVIIVTNQGGLSEDLNGNRVWKQAPLTRALLNTIHEELLRQLGPDAQPNAIVICPHAKSITCECRKPKPGMILTAAKEHKIDLKRSFMVGDMATDVMAGINAGVTPLFVLSGFEPEQKDQCPAGTLVFPSLVEAAAHMIASQRKVIPAPGRGPVMDSIPDKDELDQPIVGERIVIGPATVLNPFPKGDVAKAPKHASRRKVIPAPGRGPVMDSVPEKVELDQPIVGEKLVIGPATVLNPFPKGDVAKAPKPRK